MPTAAPTSRPSAVDHLSHLRPVQKSNNNMSITQTYYLAHKARAKLSHEAAQPDHDLRLLVGHANLLDSLMVELADAEREQERWFNNSVRRADKVKAKAAAERHIQWVDQIVEEAIDSDDEEEEEEEEEYDSETSDSDSDSEYDEDEEMMVAAPIAKSTKSTSQRVVDEDISNDDLEEDYAQLELVRAPSHSFSSSSSSLSPPELVDHDFESSSSSSDDEVMLPSPVDAELPPLDKDITMANQEDSLFEEEFYQPAPAGLAPAIPVY